MPSWRYMMGQKDARIGLRYPALAEDEDYMDGWEEEHARQSGDTDMPTDAERRALDTLGSSNT